MTLINVYQNDKLYDINFTLKDANGVVVDITGASLILRAQKQGATAQKFAGTMSIVLAVAGTCKYNVAANDFDEVGDYYAEVQVTFGGGKVITFGDIVVRCKPELPR